MAAFTDRLGREWELGITVKDLKPLKAAGFDFAGFLPTEAGSVLLDPERLVQIVRLFAHVPDAVTEEEFADGFDGPALGRAGEALLEACADFCPTSRLAQWMRGRLREGLEAMGEAVIRSIDSPGGASNSPAESADCPPPPSGT